MTLPASSLKIWVMMLGSSSVSSGRISTRCSSSRRPHSPMASTSRIRAKKGSGLFCRDGPKGASHKLDLSPFQTRIGVFRDAAFQFYYPENLEALGREGAKLIEVSPLRDAEVPELDALYIGGGFPEVHAARLGENTEFTTSIRESVEAGMPVYAECAGLMYLARELIVDGITHSMAGVLDLVVEQLPTPQGHGYEVAVVDRDNQFFAAGTRLVGHEFHYSRLVNGSNGKDSVLRVERGTGIGDGRDGISSGRVFASYLHLHAGATPGWADGFLSLAEQYAAERDGSTAACG